MNQQSHYTNKPAKVPFQTSTIREVGPPLYGAYNPGPGEYEMNKRSCFDL